MNITLKGRGYRFQPWKPGLGCVFRGAFAFDCETTLIDDRRPWLAPAYVLGAAFDGEAGFWVPREAAEPFLRAHQDSAVVFHHAPFDLAVLHTLAPAVDVYRWVDRDLAWDTQLLHRLYALGTDGHVAGGKDRSTLEHCAEAHLGIRLAKDVTDSEGNPVRLSYGRWLNRPPGEIEAVYLEYLSRDAVVTWLLYQELQRRLKDLLDGGAAVWGYVSPAWLREQVARWGPQTHHIQLRAAVVLGQVTANGLCLDLARRDVLADGLRESLAGLAKELRGHGHLAGGKGSGKSLQAVLERIQRRRPDVRFPRTDTGLYSATTEALQDLAESEPFVGLLLRHRAVEKLLNSFVDKMCRPVLRPSFNVLARTGRTTSFGEVNSQNLPTDDRVRSCFVPRPGHVYLDADYATIEMATLAQVCLTQLDLGSRMAGAINAGKDLHTLVAARVKNKSENEVTKAERKKAKPINFGKPGGMGNEALRRYAKASYGIDLTTDEVEALSAAWFGLFPEMRGFLADTGNTPLGLARLLGLTPASHSEHTGDGRFARHPANRGKEHEPSDVLGKMCLKVLGAPHPVTSKGVPYPAADLDFFWARVETLAASLPKRLRTGLARREPSAGLRRAVVALADRAGVFTLTGRLRANAGYCARHNTTFQGLAADGAKLALWRLWRAGYRIVNFVHDQVLVEVPEGADLRAQAEDVRRHMVAAMREVVPDVRVDVACAAAERWYKDAEAVYGPDGRLLPWRPAETRPARAGGLAGATTG